MKLKLCLIAILAVCVFLSSTCDILNGNENKNNSNNNTTDSSIKNLGNIKVHISGSNSVNFAYARNIWDMHLFGNRIYIGYGNFYFGMGTMDGEPGTLSELSGTIIKIPFDGN